MGYKYKDVDTRTLKGLKYAEYLKSHGWKIISVGFYNILFEKKTGKNIKWMRKSKFTMSMEYSGIQE